MKKIVILEDRPSRLKNFIQVINQDPDNGMEVDRVYYYHPKLRQDSEEIAILGQELHVDVQVVNLWNFEKMLDELYQKQDFLFIFDTDLGEMLEENVFSYRINVNYAMRKKNADKEYKIWFYTVAGPDFEKAVKRVFPEHVLEAHLEDNGQIALNLQGCPTFQNVINQFEILQ